MVSKSESHPISQACLYCRSKHLKCDAERPTCKRCRTNNSECVYVQSRRGLVGGRRKRADQPTVETIVLNPNEGSNDQVALQRSAPSTDAAGVSPPSSVTAISVSRSSPPLGPVNGDQLIDVYYSYVHPAHPLIVPHKVYKQTPDILPPFLTMAMSFIAAHSVSTEFAEAFYQPAYAIVYSQEPETAFKVQAFILLTIASYARCDRDLGDKCLQSALAAAARIGLHKDTFGSKDSEILRESWRRTWWELYSISTLISVLNPTTSRLQPSCDLRLPCQESSYAICRVPASQTFNDMQDRAFSNREFAYSSFAYRVEASNILGNVLNYMEQLQFTPGSNLLANGLIASMQQFRLTIAKTTKDESPEARECDEMQTCALMMINLASILLHLPQSTLSAGRAFPTICMTSRPPSATAGDASYHTKAALDSADTITRLIIDRSAESLSTLSPCFSCALAFAVTTQLSAYCTGQLQARAQYAKEYIQFSLSALDNMGDHWPVARAVKSQLADYTREIIGKRKRARDDLDDVIEQGIRPAPMDPNLLMLEDNLENEIWLQDLLGKTPSFVVPPA